MQSEYHGGTIVPPFMGCLRNLKLAVGEGIVTDVEFPDATQYLVRGVCPL